MNTTRSSFSKIWTLFSISKKGTEDLQCKKQEIEMDGAYGLPLVVTISCLEHPQTHSRYSFSNCVSRTARVFEQKFATHLCGNNTVPDLTLYFLLFHR